MATVELNQIATFSDFFVNARDSRILVIYGGAGSGKSVAVAQHICLKLLTEKNIRILVVRKTLPALKITAFVLIKEILSNLGIKYHLNKTEMTLSYGDNQIIFRGMDDPEKIKSFEANYVWIEEATDVTQNDINQLNLRMRRANTNGQNQMYLTFNPIDANHHIITKMVEPARHGLRNDITIHHSTYKTNPFLDDVYIEQLENLINIDENFYRVYALGEPGVLKGLVLTNWKVADASYDSLWSVPPLGYGVDFGFNAPTAITAVWFRDHVLYVRELYFKRKQTNTDLIDWIAEMSRQHPARRLIHPGIAFYADSAEPARIEEFGRAGIPTYPADKDVKKGLEILKSHQIVVHPESVNLIKELQNYKYKPTKDGDGFIDEVVKAYDHCLTGDTLVMTERGEVQIKDVTTSDKVLTHDGSYQRVLWSGMTSPESDIIELTLSNGAILTGTPNHPIYITGVGWVPLDALRYLYIPILYNSDEWKSMKLSLMGLSIDDTQIQNVTPIVFITDIGGVRRPVECHICTSIFGSLRMVWRFLSDAIYTILMEILSTIRSTISKQSITSFMRRAIHWNTISGSVISQGKFTSAKYINSCIHVVSVKKNHAKLPVYNLHVENNHNFFANGILVHNCIDSFRYLCSTANIEGMVIPIEAIKKHSSDSSTYIRGRGIDSRFPYDPMAGVRASIPFKTGMRPPVM